MPNDSLPIDPELIDEHEEMIGIKPPKKRRNTPLGILEELIKFDRQRGSFGNGKPKKEIDLSSIEGTNAETEGIFRNPYLEFANKEYEINPGLKGWTNPVGEIFINDTPDHWGPELANSVSHESLHRRRMGLRGKGSYAFFGPEGTIDSKLLKNPQLRKQLPTYNMDSKEEQLANLFGYEGALPKGKSLMQSDLKELFSFPSYLGGGLDPNLVDYYMRETSYPYDPLYNRPDDTGPSMVSQALKTLRDWAVRKGFNTVNR